MEHFLSIYKVTMSDLMILLRSNSDKAVKKRSISLKHFETSNKELLFDHDFYI